MFGNNPRRVFDLRHMARPWSPQEIERARAMIRAMWCSDGLDGGPCESPVCPKRHLGEQEIRRRLGAHI